MLRWNDVVDQELFGTEYKMYREMYRSSASVKTPYRNLELDHYAFKHIGSELFAYRILDTNFTQYMEERGDLYRINTVSIPTVQDQLNTVL